MRDLQLGLLTGVPVIRTFKKTTTSTHEALEHYRKCRYHSYFLLSHGILMSFHTFYGKLDDSCIASQILYVLRIPPDFLPSHQRSIALPPGPCLFTLHAPKSLRTTLDCANTHLISPSLWPRYFSLQHCQSGSRGSVLQGRMRVPRAAPDT